MAAESDISICNQALGGIGAKRINDLETDTSLEAQQCRLHFEPTRDALEQSFPWRFTRGRETLSEDTETPDFQWDRQFILPTDYLAMKSVYEGRFSDENIRSYDLEGDRLLTDETTVELRYVKKVTDASKFDPLFVQLLVLHLELKLVMPLTQDVKLKRDIKEDLALFMPDVLAFAGQETNTAGRLESSTWHDASSAGRDPSSL